MTKGMKRVHCTDGIDNDIDQTNNTDDVKGWLDKAIHNGAAFGSNKANYKPFRAPTQPWYWRAKIIAFYDPAKWWRGPARKKDDARRRSRHEGFERLKTCHRKQRNRINKLLKGSPGMVALAAVLDSCRAGHRCGSMACCLCMRRMRRVVVSQALNGIHGLRPQYHTTQTLEEMVMYDQSDLVNVARVRQGFLKAKKKLGKGGVLAAWLEISYDPILQGYLPHLHIYSAGYKHDELDVFHPGLQLDGKRREVKDPIRRRRIKRGDEMELMTYVFKQFPPKDRSRKRRAIVEGLYEDAQEASVEMKRITILGGLEADDMILLRGLKRDRNGAGYRRA